MRRIRALLLFAVLGVACGAPHAGTPPLPDAGIACSRAEDCDDGVFCNGPEQCAPGAPDADGRGCVAEDVDPCTPPRACDEDARRCVTVCALGDDADGDGSIAVECGGDDCDDGDPARWPGNPEVCDVEDRDEDCDPSTFGARDADGDGAFDARCCNVRSDGVRLCGLDCDDTIPFVRPGGVEVCNGLDDDCDGDVDEGVLARFYPDADGDGHGDPAGEVRLACHRPTGYASAGDDCDDADPAVHPGASERCDPERRDEDCDGEATPPALCACHVPGDVRSCAADGVCAEGREQCVDGVWSGCTVAPRTEICNALDDDCDGNVDEGLTVTCFADIDEDGYAALGAPAVERCPVSGRAERGGCPTFLTDRAPMGTAIDCVDEDASVRPGGTETCDGRDEDCDGAVDEGVSARCWPDRDGDGYAAAGTTASSLCHIGPPACPSGWTARDPATGADCGEGVALARPQARSQPAYTAIADAFCADGQPPCTSPDGRRRCRPDARDVCTDALPEASWDYNCDGLVDRPASHTGCRPCCCTTVFEDCVTTCAYPGTGCGAAGWVVAPTDHCGAEVEYRSCGPVGDGGCDYDFLACVVMPSRRMLPCR